MTRPRYLLDVNVLVALLDPTHVHHDAAHDWFGDHGHAAWATCPITENAVLRILGNPRYANSPGAPAVVASSLASLCALPGHTRWDDTVSLLDAAHFDSERFSTHHQLTDTYLLGLARARGGRLATFDRRLVTSAVRDGQAHLHVI